MTGQPREVDVLIVGAGPAGLAAGAELAAADAGRVEILEREQEAGGIPRHCHHGGFGGRLDRSAYAWASAAGSAYARKGTTGPDFARRGVKLPGYPLQVPVPDEILQSVPLTFLSMDPPDH
ncbi:NAD(P)-binding protein, partial [Streptomyces sp. NPDC048556]|uniref:NAD(P)-binding protein n=1 Tax=Streptomyces sp. NPDC048556 TaxID=3156664 RepID=UPI0034279247